MKRNIIWIALTLALFVRFLITHPDYVTNLLSTSPWVVFALVVVNVMNVAVLSLTPFLVAASMSMAMRQLTAAGVLDFGLALRGMAGMMVSVLMPAMVKKYLPLDGDGGAPGRAMLAAAAAITAAAAGAGVMAGGAGGGVGGAAGRPGGVHWHGGDGRPPWPEIRPDRSARGRWHDGCCRGCCP